MFFEEMQYSVIQCVRGIVPYHAVQQSMKLDSKRTAGLSPSKPLDLLKTLARLDSTLGHRGLHGALRTGMGSGVGRVNKGKGSHKRNRRKRTLARAVDQIHEDLADPMKAEQLRSHQPVDFDLPGLGQHYCVECARYFLTEDVLEKHTRTKKHKIRCKELKETPYSQAEAEAAAGMAPPDNGPNVGK